MRAYDEGNLRLDPNQIVMTIDRLRDRIGERFPDSGLRRIADDLFRVARVTFDRLQWVGRPNLPLRIGTGLVIATIVALLLLLLFHVNLPGTLDDLSANASEFVQALDAALNGVVLIGAALFFLVTVEARIKRRRALRFLRELRALAHIVDMHQLTKDPERVSYAGMGTASSPRLELTPFELSRYLDYCSEMLSLISKIAALYAQTYDDVVVLSAVDEVENLSAGLSRKIWQKIMIIERVG
jgi:hypothetical protein